MQIPIFRGGGCVKKVKLGQLVSIQTGKLDANAAVFGGKYPFFTTAKEISRINEYAYDGEVVLVAGNGDLNVKYYKGKFNAYQRTYILTSNSNVRMKYLYYFLDKYIEVLRYQSIGGVIKYIKLNNLSDAQIPMRSIFEQDKIIGILEKLDNEIIIRSKQLSELSNLVKSRFNEMFGGNKQFESIDNLFDIIDGDRGKNYPKSDELFDEEYCLFLNTKNVTKNGFSFITNQFITETKDKLLRKGKLERYDIVLTTRGTVGNVAYYDESIKYKHLRINSGMVILRPKKPNLNQKFIIHVLRNNNYSRVISGSAQPQLPITKLKKILLPLPPLSLQNEFADFVAQVDKSQFACQMAIKLWRNSLKSSII